MVSNFFHLHPYFWEMIQFDLYFSNGLKPPSSRMWQTLGTLRSTNIGLESPPFWAGHTSWKWPMEHHWYVSCTRVLYVNLSSTWYQTFGEIAVEVEIYRTPYTCFVRRSSSNTRNSKPPGCSCRLIHWKVYNRMLHIMGDGHQPDSMGLYTHNCKDSLLKMGWPSPM